MSVTHVAARGGAAIAAAGTSEALALTSATAVAVGNLLVLFVASDNTGANGAAPALGVVDPRGNTWTSLGASLRDPGLASEGAYVEAFAAVVVTGYQVGDTLTLTSSPAPGRVAWGLNEFAGARKTVAAGPAAANGTAAVALAVGVPAAGQLVLAALAEENNVAATGDADTLNGPWTTLASRVSDSGVWSSSITLIAQAKIVTAAGAQTWNPSLGASVDWAAVALTLAASAFAVAPTYDDSLGRVAVAITDIDPLATSVRVQRSIDGVTWVDVRGATGLAASTATQTVYDYEFTPGESNTYRAQALTAAGEVFATATGALTPTPTQVWLKSVARPFLNRPVTVHDYSDITRPARGAVFDVIGRRLPVAVTEIRGSRRFELTLRANTTDEVDALELFAAFGDVVYLQPPAGSPVPGPLYAHVGDVTVSKGGRHQLPLRFLTWPLTEVDAPDPAIVGYTITWAGVGAAWATWGALLADAAVPTWLDLLEHVSAPADEIVA